MKKLILIIAACTFCRLSMAGVVDTLSIYSVSMKKDIKCVIIKPDNYNNRERRYPVVYLLHGYSGSYKQWPSLATQLQEKVDQLQLIIVCPDGGYGSWYFDSPIDSSFRYETFVSKEVVEFIDQHYYTQADRKHRAISGLSMGGHGGLFLAIHHRNLYGAAGSMSGGVDFRPFPNNWDLSKRLGDTTCCKLNWEKNTVINLVSDLKNGDLRLIIDCGVADFFIQVNRDLHRKLLALKIDHDYYKRPGAHNNAYWKNSVDYQLLFFKKFFDEEF